MELTWIDLTAFAAFLVAVVGVSMYAARKEANSEDYFLAGRGLTWPLVGVSLIASNISTEHFVGMAGSAFGRVGLAIASYEWMAAVTLVLVGWFFLPRFLRAGIYTIPEFMEYRYDATTRAIMAFFLMIAYVVVAMATVLYSGAILFNTLFGLDMVAGIWLIGTIAGIYTIYGGLKAVVWSDLIQGGALLAGGALVTVLGFRQLGGEAGLLAGIRIFGEANADKLHMVLPWNDPTVPWVAVFIGGLWIPNTFYWGLNQFITQRTLAARSVAEGQKGILFAAFLKLAIPFIIVIPGIMAFQLFGDQITNDDGAYPYMMRQILPPQFRGIMFAALCGAVMSSFNSMLNSASTIFTIDLYQRHLRPQASQRRLVTVGRVATAGFVVISCLWAPTIARFEGVFQYIQLVWGFISPGIVAAFLVGLVVRKAPPLAGAGAMVLSLPVYGTLNGLWPEVCFLHHMGFTFLVAVAFALVVTWIRPLDEPRTMPRSRIDARNLPSVYAWGGVIIVLTAALYVLFW